MRLFPFFRKRKVEEKYPWVLIDYHQLHWEIRNPRCYSEIIFLELQDLIPPNSVLYIEDGAWGKGMKLFLEKYSVQGKPKIPGGTTWPKPNYAHIPIQGDALKELATLSKNLAKPEIANHIHVYKDDSILIQWYDFLDDPILSSLDIPEDKIIKFCNNLNTRYEKKQE